jgi:pyruvate,water dikinase
VVGIDAYLTDEWYPGFTPALAQSLYIVEPFRRFTEADKDRFWFLDFHWARGLTPLALIWNQDGYSWGTQLAAEQMPLPTGRGMTQRIAGTHTYAAVIPVRNKHAVAARDQRMRTYLPRFLDRFEQIWTQRRDEIETGWRAFLSRDYSALSDDDLATGLREARLYYRRTFEIHFEMMYPLITNYLGFRGLCGELGVEPAIVAKFLQGYDTKIAETDRALWSLAIDARSRGLDLTFAATPADQLGAALETSDTGRRWLQRLATFLDDYGHRTAGTADVALPSWIEDPTPVFSTLQGFLQHDQPHDFAAAQASAIEEREGAIDDTRRRLTRSEQQLFDAGLASVQHANFPWWQDDHNYYIDLRASLPIRWAALELANRIGADRYDDTMYLFWPELLELADRQRSYTDLRTLVEARRQYFDHWQTRRSQMPKVLGTIPDEVDDPMLIEIYGLDRQYMSEVRAEAAGLRVSTLRGVPVARGSASGRARVLRDPSELDKIQSGEILVCESISVSWTLVFSRIAACVCDSGGMLSHAAIVGREYGVPTVTACGVATSSIRDGDDIHVDGATGVVTIMRRRS